MHQQQGAKIVEFAGFLMPIQYHGIMQEHKRVRSTAGLFDVSHMGEFFISGDRALDFVQKMTVNDASRLDINQAQYSAMCYKDGGIVDDLIVYRLDENLYMMVVNAGNIDKDWQWLQENLDPAVDLRDESDTYSLLALQGPKAGEILATLTDIDLDSLSFYWFTRGKVAGVEMVVSRTGYTGEPGFELLFERPSSETVWNALLQAGEKFDIEPIGLGARDTLRLEMGYCLYGNDITAETHPLEAGLGWITKLKKPYFIGQEALQRAKSEGLSRKLVGFILEGKAFPRHGYPILSGDEEIGFVTSGTFSPMLEQGIGMGYVAIDYAAPGTGIAVRIRDRQIPEQVDKTPFYQK